MAGFEVITEVPSLDVDFQGQRVMTIDCNCRDDRYAGRIWSTEDVSGFIEGPWVAEQYAAFAEVSHLEEARNCGRNYSGNPRQFPLHDGDFTGLIRRQWRRHDFTTGSAI